jgi:hypothetical protein
MMAKRLLSQHGRTGRIPGSDGSAEALFFALIVRTVTGVFSSTHADCILRSVGVCWFTSRLMAIRTPEVKTI